MSLVLFPCKDDCCRCRRGAKEEDFSYFLFARLLSMGVGQSRQPDTHATSDPPVCDASLNFGLQVNSKTSPPPFCFLILFTRVHRAPFLFVSEASSVLTEQTKLGLAMGFDLLYICFLFLRGEECFANNTRCRLLVGGSCFFPTTPFFIFPSKDLYHTLL